MDNISTEEFGLMMREFFGMATWIELFSGIDCFEEPIGDVIGMYQQICAIVLGYVNEDTKKCNWMNFYSAYLHSSGG